MKRKVKNCFLLYNYKRFDLILLALKKRKFPTYLTAYGGSQWWALPMDLLKFILEFLETNPDYIKYHRFTHVPDEIFFHSIISSNFPISRIKSSITYQLVLRKS